LNQGKDINSVIDNSTWINLALGGLSATTLIIVLWFFLKRRKSKIKDLGFKKFTKKDFFWMFIGLVVYFILLIIAITIANLIPGFNEEEVQNIGYTTAAGWQLMVAFVGLVVIPPLAEEMLFRGFLYRGLASKWPKIIAALVASVFFAVLHFQWNVGIDVFVLSLVMIFLLEKTKNLWVCVGLHAIKNGIAFLAIFVFASH
ncbi:MAG: type II CAAX endopeptidase family protein, partial [Actinomycetota bacterium]